MLGIRICSCSTGNYEVKIKKYELLVGNQRDSVIRDRTLHLSPFHSLPTSTSGHRTGSAWLRKVFRKTLKCNRIKQHFRTHTVALTWVRVHVHGLCSIACTLWDSFMVFCRSLSKTVTNTQHSLSFLSRAQEAGPHCFQDPSPDYQAPLSSPNQTDSKSMQTRVTSHVCSNTVLNLWKSIPRDNFYQ